MKKLVFGLYDKVARSYRNPIFGVSSAVLIRDLGDEVRRGGDDNQIARHPGDFRLDFLGYFDEESGMFTQLFTQEESPELVVEVLSLVEPKL